MANKSTGKHYTSKGERKSSISTKNTDPAQRLLNQVKALAKGKDVVWSLLNTSKDGKVMPNTRLKVNGKEHLKRQQNNFKPAKGEAE